MVLTKQQLEIIQSPEDRIVVMASAGTSKTTVLTERIKYWLSQGAKPEEIVAITFTVQASEEMRERLGVENLFCSTVHSYANYILLTHNIDTKQYLEEENFDALFKLVKEHPEVVEPVKYLCLDEAQDSDEEQFEFIFDILKPEHFFLCGDVKQCIYSWKGSRPDLFYGAAAVYGAKMYQLTENFRNSKEILNFAKWIIEKKLQPIGRIPYYDDSIGLVKNQGFKTTFEYDLRTIVRMVTVDDHYSDWFILARTNDRVTEIYNYLKKYDVPVDTFKKADLSHQDLQKKMHDNTVKVLTIHAAKGLEANKVIVVDATMSKEEECRISYVAATRAKHELYWAKKPIKKKKSIQKWT